MVYNHLQFGYDENGLTYDQFCEHMASRYDIFIEDDIDTSLVKIIYGKLK